MSKLRQTILEQIRIIGNHSGCHQLPERSFFYKGKQFPVCARCTGVCIGQSIAIVLSFKKTYGIRIPFLLLAVMGLDWGIQESGIKKSTNMRRFITGLSGGFGLFSLYIQLIKKFILAVKSTSEVTAENILNRTLR